MFQAPPFESFGSGTYTPFRKPERPAEPVLTLEEGDVLIALYFSVQKIDERLRHEALTQWVDSGLAETLGFYAFLGWEAQPVEVSLPTVRIAA